MREIKFRAWNKKEKVMDEPCIFLNRSDVDVEELNSMEYEAQFLLNGALEKLQKEDVVLLQFTGLHDKNGREVYEGDVLSGGFEDAYVVEDMRRIYYEQVEMIFDVESSEIIGNIYESKHLLDNIEL